MKSEVNVWYLDVGSLTGQPEIVLEDFKAIIEKSAKIGLPINHSKCEIHFCGEISKNALELFNDISPGIQVIQDDITLLSAPLWLTAAKDILLNKLETMRKSFINLEILKSHVAYFLFEHCFWIPKLSFIIRTTPTWIFLDIVSDFDSCFKVAFESITNIQFNENKWNLCSLLIKDGRIGVRKVKDVGLPAFLSSVNSSHHLINYILSNDSDEVEVLFYTEAIQEWKINNNTFPSELKMQKKWDNIMVQAVKSSFNCLDKAESARFLAFQNKESSAWLNILPSCEEAFVNPDGIQGLSCRRSAGRFVRHVELNKILKLALASAQTPSRLEPFGLNNVSERPDGITLTPWSNGRFLTWDATCIDSLASIYIDVSCMSGGKRCNK